MHDQISVSSNPLGSAESTTFQMEQFSHFLLDMSVKFYSTLDSDILLDLLVQEAMGLVDAQAGCAGINTPQGMISRSYFQGTQRLPFESGWPQNQALAAWLLKHKAPYLTNRADSDLLIGALTYPRQGIRSILSIPLLGKDGTVLGFFEMHDKQAEADFTLADQEKLLALARIAASALLNALAFEQQLQRSNYQLRMDSAPLKPLEPVNIVEEQRFRTIIEHSSDAIALLDAQGNYVYISPAVQRFLGYSSEELVGRKGLDLVPPNQRAFLVETFAKVIGSPGVAVTVEHQLRHKNGSLRWIESTTTNWLHDTSIKALVSNFRDITARKQAEGLLVGEKEILERMIQGEPLPNTLEMLTGLIEEQATEEVLTSILLLEDGVHLRHGAARRLPASYMEAIDGIAIGPAVGSCGTAAYRNEAVYVSDIAVDPLWSDYRALALSHGLRACWSTPIRSSRGKVLGTFAMYYREPHFPDPLDQQLIDLVIHTAALAIERKWEEEERSRLGAVVASSDDAIVSKTLDGIITSWNAAAERMFGYKAEEAIGKPITLIIPPELHHTEKEIIQKLRQGTYIHHYETTRLRKDGRLVAVSVSISPVKDSSGKIIGASKIARDVTERKELEERKDEFISMASHELKTPVTSIKGFTQVLQRRLKQRGDEDGVVFTKHMDAQLNKLTLLINDLLDLSRIQKGQLEYREELFDLGAVAEEISGNVQETTETHQLLVENQGGVQVFGDQDRIGQVLINFLTNAIKYSSQAETVIVRVYSTDNEAVVSVQDFGVGIAEAEHQKIFERFYQAPGPGGKMYPGLGIGLHISREIIKRHHGRIGVTSEQNTGSTFWFALPLVRAVA